MGIKRIAIIGGGISGLAVLHFLKKRFSDRIEITLFERAARLGGNIATLKEADAFFECGPNGFLSNAPDTLELVNELNLHNELIDASSHAKHRYIQLNGKLVALPLGLRSFLKTSLLTPSGKWKILTGMFKKNVSRNQSIHGYITKRFGLQAAERIVDPFISGVYAGNIKRLHMGCAFPKFLNRQKGQRARMHSFKNGMGELIEGLARPYKAHIKLNSEISSLDGLDFDHIVITTPAYISSLIVHSKNPRLSELLNQISYAPIAVVGLVFDTTSFKVKPEGFGYLIPSSEEKDILGVLLESNVFEGRAKSGQVLMRIMIGGAHRPGVINDNPDVLIAKALKEVDLAYGLKGGPLHTFHKIWPKAIPQYELNYPELREAIAKELEDMPNILLTGNYLDGISFNDCIKNAKSIAGQIRFC